MQPEQSTNYQLRPRTPKPTPEEPAPPKTRTIHCGFCTEPGHNIKQCNHEKMTKILQFMENRWQESLIMNDYNYFEFTIATLSMDYFDAFAAKNNLSMKDSRHKNRTKLFKIYKQKFETPESRRMNHNIDAILDYLQRKIGYTLYWCARVQIKYHILTARLGNVDKFDKYVANILYDIYKNKKTYNGIIDKDTIDIIKIGVLDEFIYGAQILLKIWNISLPIDDLLSNYIENKHQTQWQQNHEEAEQQPEEECPICYETTTKTVKTNCNHTFCIKCISNYLLTKNTACADINCPCCRQHLNQFVVTASSNTVDLYEYLTEEPEPPMDYVEPPAWQRGIYTQIDYWL